MQFLRVSFIFVLLITILLPFDTVPSDIAPDIRKLPLCDFPPAAETAGWVLIPALDEEPTATDRITFRLPSSFRKAPPRGNYWHGGQAWQDDKRFVEEVYGQWGPNSFANDDEPEISSKWCHETIDGMETIFIESRLRGSINVTAWYRESGEVYDVTVSASSDTATDTPLLYTVLRSIKRLKD